MKLHGDNTDPDSLIFRAEDFRKAKLDCPELVFTLEVAARVFSFLFGKLETGCNVKAASRFGGHLSAIMTLLAVADDCIWFGATLKIVFDISLLPIEVRIS